MILKHDGKYGAPGETLWRSTNLHDSQTFNCTNQLIFRFWGTTNLHGSQTRGLHEAFIIHF